MCVPCVQVDDNYVARRKSDTHGEHHHHGVDYNVGRYAPKQSLGKVIVNVENSEKVNFVVTHSRTETEGKSSDCRFSFHHI